MVWIYSLEGSAEFGPLAQSIFRRLRAADHTILASHFLLAELLVVPVREQRTFTIASYRRMILGSATTEVVPFSAETVMHFASLRAFHRTQSADSIHLALAASAGADLFITNDKELPKLTVPSIGKIVRMDTDLV
jgi:predicted nucleic acid-binding protein